MIEIDGQRMSVKAAKARYPAIARNLLSELNNGPPINLADLVVMNRRRDGESKAAQVKGSRNAQSAMDRFYRMDNAND